MLWETGVCFLLVDEWRRYMGGEILLCYYMMRQSHELSPSSKGRPPASVATSSNDTKSNISGDVNLQTEEMTAYLMESDIGGRLESNI